jgi:hypothetical protein
LRRFQFDAQWQRDFGELAKAIEDCREHTAAGCMLRDAGVLDEARTQLELADEAMARADMLELALRDLSPIQ